MTRMGMRTNPRRLEWAAQRKRLEDAAARAADVLRFCREVRCPVDPLRVAHSEKKFLKVMGGDYRNRFDGQLEYHPAKRRFLLFYNTRYNDPTTPSVHAPRTRFSIAHELGHYFLDAHHAYLRQGNPSHGSNSDFLSDRMVEREADMFAAHLLMPKNLFDPEVNQDELTLRRLGELANGYETSFTSTAIRAVVCSDWPCAVAGLRAGQVAWMFCSDPLIDAGFYPKGRQPVPTQSARECCMTRRSAPEPVAVWASDWFATYDDARRRVTVMEHAQPVTILNTVVMLLTIPDDELDEGG